MWRKNRQLQDKMRKSRPVGSVLGANVLRRQNRLWRTQAATRGPELIVQVSLDGRGPPPRPPARGVCGRGRELTALFVTVAGCETGPVTLAMS